MKQEVNDSNKSFDAILTILCSSQSLLIFAQCLLANKNNNNIVNVEVNCKLPTYIPRCKNNEVFVCESDIINVLSNEKKPTKIEFSLSKQDQKNNILSKATIKAPDISFIRKSIIQGAFIQFYEMNKPNQNLPLNNYPDEWKFAWMIRNAFAHGRKITWTNTNVDKVQWDIFSYDRCIDNGKEIIFKEFSEADIILLLIQLGK
jgi:hypothetical protein